MSRLRPLPDDSAMWVDVWIQAYRAGRQAQRQIQLKAAAHAKSL